MDRGQLENAILNLAINARDAMPRGGKLTIETANAELDADDAARHGEMEPGQYVMIAISDTGSGMPPEVLQRAFGPFFTTKDIGKGTGLGLSMVYGFAKQSKGPAAIYSEVGHGTTVKRYLPKSSGVAERTDAASPQAKTPLKRGRETLLVVEGDEAVRDFLAAALRSVGYEVLEAADGEAARTQLSAGGISLLITDVVLPGGMTGRDVAEEARTLRPGMRVLYVSGYARSAIIHQGKLDDGVQLLTKPFTRESLIHRVRELLDAAED